MALIGHTKTLSVLSAERAPSPTLPRKREREQTVSVEKKQP
jgi:hypothetical protein